jgi:hypothetical protein
MRAVKLAALGTALVLAIPGCGDDDTNDPLGITNVAPTGSVGGMVLDLATGQAMAGVNVKVVSGGAAYPVEGGQVATDADGRWAVTGVPSGRVIIDIKPPAGYMQVRIPDLLLDDAAGDFPVGNASLTVGPILLAPVVADTAALKIRIVQPDGSAATGVNVTAWSDLSYAEYANGRPAARGRTDVSVTTDNSGVATLSGLPDLAKLVGKSVGRTINIAVLPFDSDGDGVFDFVGTTETIDIANIGNTGETMPTIVLRQGNIAGLNILASTIPALQGQPGNRVLGSAAGPLFVVFNIPVDQTLTQVRLYDEQGDLVTEEVTKSVTGNVLSLGFKNLSDDTEYNMELRAVAWLNNQLRENFYTASFFTPPGASPTLTAQLAWRETIGDNDGICEQGEVCDMDVTFSRPIGTGNPSNNANQRIMFFDFDLDGSNTKGDASGEQGFTSTNITLSSTEKSSPGPGRSGFSTTWRFNPPNPSGNPLPASTTVRFSFSLAGSLFTTPDGNVIQDVTGQIPARPAAN